MNGAIVSRVSSAALREATGRGWDAWLDLLDAGGAAAMSHKELVAHLEQAYGDSTTAWWRQTLAVGYEQERGGRVVGRTADAGFQLGVQRTVGLPLQRTWDLLAAQPSLWLDADVVLEEGRTYESPQARGEVRVVRPGERLRLTWQPTGWSRPATLQLTVSAPAPGRTAVHVHLEKLPDAQTREDQRAHWRRVLQRVAEAAEEAQT